MKRIARRILSLMLALLMVITAVPLTGIESQAAGISGYSGEQAAVYAKNWWNGRNDIIWADYDLWGGDCANFISQCLYAGGIPMTSSWYFHKETGLNADEKTTERTETWTVANKLCNYLISIGGQVVNNPSASQISIGDVIFYDWDSDGSYNHSAICTGYVDGVPQIACHYRKRTASTIIRNQDHLTTDWTLGAEGYKIRLVKLYGSTCYSTAPTYDVYKTTNKISGLIAGSILHVTQTSYSNGKLMGLCKIKGVEKWVTLTGYAYYVTHVDSVYVTHAMSNWYTVSLPTCITEGKDQRVCSKCGYTQTRSTGGGEHINIVAATCLEPSYCTACGTTISDPLGHNFGEWSYIVEPTCTEGGTRTHTCVRCNYKEQEDVDALGHDDVHITTSPTCTDNGTACYECQRCGRQTVNYIDSENTISDWTDEVVDGLEPVESKVQYRYKDKNFTTTTSSSSTASKDGWTPYDTTWVWGDYGSWSAWQDSVVSASDSRQVETQEVVASTNYKTVYNYYRYAAAYTGGYSNYVYSSSHPNYYTYTFDSPLELYESASPNKYTYWYSSANYIVIYESSPYTTQEVVSYNYKTQYRYRDRSPVYTHYFYQWSDWSEWQDEEVTISDTRDVELRTVYKYDLAALGHDFSVEDDNSYTAPTCTEPGHIGVKCFRCGALSPDGREIDPLGHLLYDAPEYTQSRDELIENGEDAPYGYWYFDSVNSDGDTVYRRDCGRECGYHEFKIEGNNNCIYELTDETERTCTQDHKYIYTCKDHGETMEVIVEEAYGHEEDKNWILTDAASCANGGKEGKEICCCVRYDNGQTCDKVFERTIPAPDHVEVTDDGKDATCIQTGLTDGTHCSVCNEILTAQEKIDSLGHNDGVWICINEGYEDFIGTSKDDCDALEVTCGTALRFELHCTRVCYDEKCNALLDEYEREAPECDFVETERVESDCTINGYVHKECTQCGKDLVDMLDPLGHLEGDEYTFNATCTEEGYVAWDCQRDGCDYSEVTEILDATGHALSPFDDGYDSSDDQMELISSIANVCGDDTIDTYQCTHINDGVRCDYTVVIGNAQDHDMGEWFTVTEPTCEDYGLEQQKCQNEECTYYIENTLDPIGHNYLADSTVDATCEENGYVHYVCQNDSSHTYDGDYFPSLGHEADNKWVQIKAPTCAEEGEEQCYCVRYDDGETCEKIYTRTISVDPDAHNWDEGVIAPDSTCTVHGTKTYTCQNDASHTYTEEVALDENNHIGDTYIKDNKDATCTEDGYTGDTYCADCDNKIAEGEVIPATDHAWGEWTTVTPATCEEDGLEKRICKNDSSHVEENVLPAIGHDWDEGVIDPSSTCTVHGTKTYTCQNDASHTYTEEVALDENNHVGDTYIKDNKDATCTQDGYTGDTYCADCDKKIAEGEAIPALGHDMGEWYEVTKATCTEKGLEKRDCSRCDYSEERETEINSDNHYAETFYTVDEKADCENDGKKSHHCERCDESLDEVVIPAREHVYDNGVETKAPTCTEDGVKTFTCTNEETNEYNACTHSYTEVIPATGHDWGNWETVTPTTCEADGLEKRICKNDTSHVEENILPATGHDYVGITTAPNCTEQGYTKYTCSICGDTYNDDYVDAIGHDWDNGVIAPDSTCTVHGTKTYTCQNDASHTKTEVVALDENNHVGDTYIKDEKDVTCIEDGYTGDTYCADCNKKLESGEVIPATGHDWGEWTVFEAPTYTEMGTEKRICNNCGAEETRPLPVLTRPSDENENIETEKTVEYDSVTGEAEIKLVASSKGEKITVNSRTPLDIVLVLDQSGSMEGDLLEKLKTATDDFTNAIYQDAVENGIDHRIAMVGFAMQNQYNFGSEYPQYLNTEILTTGGAPIQYNSLSAAQMNEVYKNALVSVNVDGGLNPVLTLAKDNLQAKGATAADLGLDMACQIFAQNENDGSRKRIVVFMTDGVPTYKSDYMEETATNATTKANLLKDAYEADLYSVGVLSGNNTSKAKTFLNNIASKDENNNALYFDCADAEKLVEDFQTIATQSTTVITDFADITLIDTVSSAFTLTAVQENELRKNAIEKLGITNDDITVTRYADGTTEVKLEHINPVAVADGDDINYVIDIDFRVTANEKALIAGSYGTNTDNAGVLIGTTDVYENNFAVPGASVENAEGVIYFTVNGITYHIVRIHKGDTPEAPEFTLDGEYTFSGWDIPDEVVFDGGKLTVDATLTQKEYTVTWNTADGAITDTYHAGDIIVVPIVGLNANGEEFIGWDNDVPVTMPAGNLEFTAMYGKHEHEYAENVLIKVSCGVEGKVQYVCDCGDSYTETIPALAHKWATSATSSDGTETAYSHVYCENCGESPDKALEYTIKGTTGWNNKVTYDLKLTDAENITIQPDGEITISLPVPQNMKNARNITIYREEADGTLTNLNGTVKNGYITFTTTHFSIYIIEAEYECAETGNHTDENADNICDICENEIPVEEPSENCNHYCHQKGFMNFLWKIINFLYRLFGIEDKHICECGVAHW